MRAARVVYTRWMVVVMTSEYEAPVDMSTSWDKTAAAVDF